MTDLDRNVERVLKHIIPRIQCRPSQAPIHSKSSSDRPIPYILAVSGLQGSGKSTWATALVRALNEDHHIRAITVSLDDFYKTHDGLLETRAANPGNGLLRTRGQPGTHDEVLATEFFEQLKGREKTDLLVPFFDKSAFKGEGDRVPQDDWTRVSRSEPIEVLVFEGWCVGFQALPEDELRRIWQDACDRKAAEASDSADATDSVDATQASKYAVITLPEHPLGHLRALNHNLHRYNETFMGPQHFDFLVHLDTDELANVYRWRLQQEHAMLKKLMKRGMSDEDVISFVRGYMPAYELYLKQLREGMRVDVASERKTGQLRVVLDRERTVLDVVEVV